MGECISAPFNVPNEIATIQIYNEEKICIAQAIIRKYLALRHFKIKSLISSNHTSIYTTKAESDDAIGISLRKHNLVLVSCYKLPNGDYTGTMCTCCNQFNGEGKFVYNDESTYKGNWLNGKAHGHGYMKYSNGDTYNGCWKNDMAHGLGTYKKAN